MRTFLSIALSAAVLGPATARAQVTTLPATATAAPARREAPARRPAQSRSFGASSDLPFLALFGIGLLITGAGLVSSVRPSSNRA